MYNQKVREIFIAYARANNLPYPMTIEDDFNSVALWVLNNVSQVVPEVRDGNWWVYNVEKQALVDSGVQATGDRGSIFFFSSNNSAVERDDTIGYTIEKSSVVQANKVRVNDTIITANGVANFVLDVDNPYYFIVEVTSGKVLQGIDGKDGTNGVDGVAGRCVWYVTMTGSDASVVEDGIAFNKEQVTPKPDSVYTMNVGDAVIIRFRKIATTDSLLFYGVVERAYDGMSFSVTNIVSVQAYSPCVFTAHADVDMSQYEFGTYYFNGHEMFPDAINSSYKPFVGSVVFIIDRFDDLYCGIVGDNDYPDYTNIEVEEIRRLYGRDGINGSSFYIVDLNARFAGTSPYPNASYTPTLSQYPIATNATVPAIIRDSDGDMWLGKITNNGGTYIISTISSQTMNPSMEYHHVYTLNYSTYSVKAKVAISFDCARANSFADVNEIYEYFNTVVRMQASGVFVTNVGAFTSLSLQIGEKSSTLYNSMGVVSNSGEPSITDVSLQINNSDFVIVSSVVYKNK